MEPDGTTCRNYRMEPDGTTRALKTTNAILGAQTMLSIYIDNIGAKGGCWV
jgi:hypothetical protein